MKEDSQINTNIEKEENAENVMKFLKTRKDSDSDLKKPNNIKINTIQNLSKKSSNPLIQNSENEQSLKMKKNSAPNIENNNSKKTQNELKMQKSLIELINSEKSYVRGLINLVGGYKNKLEDPSLNIKEELYPIFLNCSRILEKHKTIVHTLIEQLKSTNSIPNCEMIIQVLPILLQTEEEYKEYIVDQPQSSSKLQNLLKNKKVALFFGEKKIL